MDLLGDLLGGGPVDADDLRDELHRVLVHLQLQQPQEGVQPVRVLVVLGAERVDQAAGGVEFAAEVFQLGTVAQSGHGPAVVGGHPVDEQHTAAADRHEVVPDDPSCQYVGGPACAQGLGERPAGGVGAKAEQALRLVVQQPDAPRAVERDDALTDAVQHGLALRQQGRDVGERQVVCLPLEAAGDEIGGQRPHGQRPARVGQQPRDRREEPGADAVVRDPDRHGTHDPVRSVTQWHLAAGRASEGAVVDLHHRPARERGTGVGGHDLADPGGVRMGPAHAPLVHDHDVLRAGGAPDPLGHGLNGAAGGRFGGEQRHSDLLLRRRALRDRQGPAHRLVVELGAERRQEEAGDQHRDTGDDGQLHQQDLGEDPLRPAEPAQDPRGGR